MVNKVLWSAAAVLAAACAAQAYYIRTLPLSRRPPAPDLLAREDRWLEETRRQLFGDWRLLDDDVFADLFKERLKSPGLQSIVTATPDEVIVSLELPGLRDGSLKINVDGERIRVSYEAVSEEGRGEGPSTYRSRSLVRCEEVLPIPTGADPGNSRIVREGDTFRVVFNRRPEGHAHLRA